MKSIIVKLYIYIYIYPFHLFFNKLNSQTHTMHHIYIYHFILFNDLSLHFFFTFFFKKNLNLLKHNVKQKKTRTKTFQKKWIKVVPNKNLKHFLHPKE